MFLLIGFDPLHSGLDHCLKSLKFLGKTILHSRTNSLWLETLTHEFKGGGSNFQSEKIIDASQVFLAKRLYSTLHVTTWRKTTAKLASRFD